MEEAQKIIAALNAAIINPLILVATAFAMLVFAYGIFLYIYQARDAKAHEKGRQMMLWGIIGFAIMASAYGILNLFTSSLAGGTIDQLTQQPLPKAGQIR